MRRYSFCVLPFMFKAFFTVHTPDDDAGCSLPPARQSDAPNMNDVPTRSGGEDDPTEHRQQQKPHVINGRDEKQKTQLSGMMKCLRD